MTIKLSQINSFYQRISSPSFDPAEINKAKEELDAYQAKPHDATVQKAIDQARAVLAIKENQAITVAQVNTLYQYLPQIQQLLISQPKLTMEQYSGLVKLLDVLRSNAKLLIDNDFKPTLPKAKYIEVVDQFKQQLQLLNPSAWKTDWLARGIIVSSIATLFGYYLGWTGVYQSLLGSALYLILETGLSKLGQQGAEMAARSKAQTKQPFPSPAVH